MHRNHDNHLHETPADSGNGLTQIVLSETLTGRTGTSTETKGSPLDA
jgi:hypothetical protein